jgi:hypothetical protein
LTSTLDEELTSLTSVLKGMARGLKNSAKFPTGVLFISVNPTSTTHDHAT